VCSSLLRTARLSFDNLLFPSEAKDATGHASESYEKLEDNEDEVESTTPVGDSLEPDLTEETEIAWSQPRRRRPACIEASQDCCENVLSKINGVRTQCSGDEEVSICCNRFLVSKASIRFVSETGECLVGRLAVCLLCCDLSLFSSDSVSFL
jgi:hypothetical protein